MDNPDIILLLKKTLLYGNEEHHNMFLCVILILIENLKNKLSIIMSCGSDFIELLKHDSLAQPMFGNQKRRPVKLPFHHVPPVTGILPILCLAESY